METCRRLPCRLIAPFHCHHGRRSWIADRPKQHKDSIRLGGQAWGKTAGRGRARERPVTPKPAIR